MSKRIWLSYRVMGRTFGSWLSPLVTFSLFAVLRLSISLGMVLDSLFFPRLRRTAIHRPIVIVGNPRSGTTFLHRFLTSQGLGAGTQLWRMLYPALTLQRLLHPLLPLLERISPARHHTAAAHATSLTAAETDDVSLLFRYFDGFFLYGFLLAWAEDDLRNMFDPAERDTSDRDFAWLETLWRRNLAATGDSRIIAKLFSLGARLPAFQKRFPDARVLYLVRDPVEMIPSAMSLVSGVLEQRFGFWSQPDALRQRYLDRLYRALVDLLRRFHEDFHSGAIERKRVLIVPYPRLMQDFTGLMEEILAFLEIETTAALKAAIEHRAETQRSYRSGHTYDLARFGLNEGQIREDCAFVYSAFLKDPLADHPLQNDRITAVS